jgi:hypothetical protein
LEVEGLFHEIRLEKRVQMFWKEVISQNAKVARSPMTAEEFQMEDVDESPQSSMQIHLKGNPHVIPITAADNASAIAEAFVLQHKLKTDITSRIELELLRTQVDACLSHQTKLRHQVGRLRRLCIDASMFESRALAAEGRNRRLHDLANRIQKSLLPGVQERVRGLEAERKEHLDEIARLNAVLVGAAETTNSSRKNEVIAQKKLEAAVNHCRTLQDKLRAAASLHKRFAGSGGDMSSASRYAFASGGDRTPSPPRAPTPPSPACSLSSLQLDPQREREVQAAVYEATEQLTHSYEQKLLGYESKAREQSRVLVGLERAAAVDKRCVLHFLLTCVLLFVVTR